MVRTDEVVENELRSILNDEDADDKYDKVEGALTKLRKRVILNTDLARELSPSYKRFEDRVRYTKATYKPSSQYVYKRFMETVEDYPFQGRKVLLLAGGPASGKTTSTVDDKLEEYDLIVDTTFSDYQRARDFMNQVRKYGWEAEVQYVHRPYDLAVGSMLQRAVGSGRYVTIGLPSRLAMTHMSAQETFSRIRKEFPDVTYTAIGNFWTPDKPWGTVYPIEVSLVDVGNAYHYDSLNVLHATQRDVYETFKEAQEALLSAVLQKHR